MAVPNATTHTHQDVQAVKLGDLKDQEELTTVSKHKLRVKIDKVCSPRARPCCQRAWRCCATLRLPCACPTCRPHKPARPLAP